MADPLTGRGDPDSARLYGLYPAIVTDLVDPLARGRVKVRLPWLEGGGDGLTVWARLVSPYADDDQGIEIVPEVDAEVVVGFEQGSLQRPYVLGSVWHGKAQLPVPVTAANDQRLWRTRSGSQLVFDDAAGRPSITLETASGHRVVLDAGSQSITVQHSGGAKIELSPDGSVKVTANSTFEVTAAQVTVTAPMSRFSGVVQCDTLIASTGVVSPSYTPGAGNIW